MSLDALLKVAREMERLQREVNLPPVVRVPPDVLSEGAAPGSMPDRLFGLPVYQAADGERYVITDPRLTLPLQVEPITLVDPLDSDCFITFKGDLMDRIGERFMMPSLVDFATRSVLDGEVHIDIPESQNPAPPADPGD